MRVLLDLNVVLDVLLQREAHVAGSAALWAAVERGEAEGRLSAHAVTTLFYLTARARDRAFAQRCVRDVTSVFGVSPVDARVLHRALSWDLPDFEDAVTAAAAIEDGCDLLATRDLPGFRGAPIPALPPDAALAAIRVRGR